MFHAEAGIYELLGKDLDEVSVGATVQAALEFKVEHFGIVVLEHHILDVDAFELFFVLGALLDVAMQFAILRNGMSPELAATAAFLANFKLNALLFFIFRKLHDKSLRSDKGPAFNCQT